MLISNHCEIMCTLTYSAKIANGEHTDVGGSQLPFGITMLRDITDGPSFPKAYFTRQKIGALMKSITVLFIIVTSCHWFIIINMVLIFHSLESKAFDS